MIRSTSQRWLLAMMAAISFGSVPVASQPRSGVAQRSLATRAAAYLQDLAARGLFQGAVVIARGDSVMYEGGFGLADRERRTPFTPTTIVDGGSIAKPFTAAALLTLVAEGRVDLDAPVQRYVAAYPHVATTVHHLLGHSAGLPGYEWLDGRVPANTVRTNASHLEIIRREATPPAFPPGTAFRYDNVAYDVAAMIVAQVSGESWEAFLRRRFLAPLGMQAFLRPARLAPWEGVRTRGYRRTPRGWALFDALDFEGFHGASNLYLSARDLAAWMQGYRRVVGPVVYAMARTPFTVARGDTTGITLGSWYLDGSVRQYSGHHQGFHSVGLADDASGLVVAWVANDAPPISIQLGLGRALFAMAAGQLPERLDAGTRRRVRGVPDGRYEVPGVGVIQVRRDSATLHVRARDVEYETFPVEPGVYYVPGVDAAVSFRTIARGVVEMEWNSAFRRVRVRRL
jgi:CubicO group peptidase (beta-lactamase class C family)